MELKTIIYNQKKEYKLVNEFYNKWEIQYQDCGIVSYTRNNINISVNRQDLRFYFNKDSSFIYLPFIYKNFKIKIDLY